MPAAHHDETGRRLPAGYANFLILNEAVLVPLYSDLLDTVALATLQGCFPDRKVEGLPCEMLIDQSGGLHCATMQLPAGALSSVG